MFIWYILPGRVKFNCYLQVAWTRWRSSFRNFATVFFLQREIHLKIFKNHEKLSCKMRLVYNVSMQLGGRSSPLIAINFDFLFPPIDSPNTPKEFPSYHELCSNSFSFVRLDVQCFYCAHFSFLAVKASMLRFSLSAAALYLRDWFNKAQYNNEAWKWIFYGRNSSNSAVCRSTYRTSNTLIEVPKDISWKFRRLWSA